VQVGFATVYNFYAYPDRCRMRLSQILVLPPHQGRGVGSLLLRALCQHADAVNAVDVTVSVA
jgi:histone acetyltransferase 1